VNPDVPGAALHGAHQVGAAPDRASAVRASAAPPLGHARVDAIREGIHEPLVGVPVGRGRMTSSEALAEPRPSWCPNAMARGLNRSRRAPERRLREEGSCP
jgi:hypothetical protein